MGMHHTGTPQRNMKRTPTTIQTMPDRFVPRGRTVHPLSSRCCVGEHPSGRGRRAEGYMLIYIRHEYHARAFVRELDVNEAFTMRELYDIISRECPIFFVKRGLGAEDYAFL